MTPCSGLRRPAHSWGTPPAPVKLFLPPFSITRRLWLRKASPLALRKSFIAAPNNFTGTEENIGRLGLQMCVIGVSVLASMKHRS